MKEKGYSKAHQSCLLWLATKPIVLIHIFGVGAALLCEDGTIYEGCNIENASYGLTNCAERTAIFKAVSEGQTKFKALAVVADTEGPCAPCGACRQVISEFEIPRIIMANLRGDYTVVELEGLLPFRFGADNI